MATITRPMFPPVRKPYTFEKLKGARSMTIAAGLRFTGGVLLAADSEITDGASEYSKSKLITEPISSAVSMAFSYSGSMDYAIMAIQEIMAVTRSYKSRTHAQIYVTIKDTLKESYSESIGSLPDFQRSDAAFNLLISIWAEGQTKLLTSESTAVVEEKEYRCFGIGKDLAKFLFNPIYL
jgi:20S proteasome alpha/beta subunit